MTFFIDLLWMMGISLLIVTSLMFLLWGLYFLQKNISILELGWSFSFIIVTAIYLLLGEGYVWRKIFVMTIVSIWALRLIFFLVQRYQLHQEQSRYQVLINAWTDDYKDIKILGLFMFQGLMVVILSLPFALMSQNILPFFTTFEVFGLLLWMAGMYGEAEADNQLLRFKSDPANANQVCERGLWYYSRHPNYFFEWIIWISYFIITLPSPFGWLAIISPLFILYLLLKVTGIPLVEAEALQTKGEAYRKYQDETSSFFPWFKL